MSEHLLSLMVSLVVIGGGVAAVARVVWSLVQSVRDNTKAVQALTARLDGFDGELKHQRAVLDAQSREMAYQTRELSGQSKELIDHRRRLDIIARSLPTP